MPWRRARQPTPVFLPGESHGQRSLAGHSPCGHVESDTTERLHFHFLQKHQIPTVFPGRPLSSPRALPAWTFLWNLAETKKPQVRASSRLPVSVPTLLGVRLGSKVPPGLSVYPRPRDKLGLGSRRGAWGLLPCARLPPLRGHTDEAPGRGPLALGPRG